jgi:hypothetical protein
MVSIGQCLYTLRLAAIASFETAAAASCLWRRTRRHQTDRKELEVSKVCEKWRKVWMRCI